MKRYQPRNDYVIVKLIDLGKTEKGLVIPSISREAKELRVIAIGNEVKHLKVGDSVLINATVDTFPLPNETALFAVKQEFVAVVILDPEKEER